MFDVQAIQKIVMGLCGIAILTAGVGLFETTQNITSANNTIARYEQQQTMMAQNITDEVNKDEAQVLGAFSCENIETIDDILNMFNSLEEHNEQRAILCPDSEVFIGESSKYYLKALNKSEEGQIIDTSMSNKSLSISLASIESCDQLKIESDKNTNLGLNDNVTYVYIYVNHLTIKDVFGTCDISNSSFIFEPRGQEVNTKYTFIIKRK